MGDAVQLHATAFVERAIARLVATTAFERWLAELLEVTETPEGTKE
jgi:hypothetical protein